MFDKSKTILKLTKISLDKFSSLNKFSDFALDRENKLFDTIAKDIKRQFGKDLLEHQARVVREALTYGDRPYRKLLVWGTGKGKTLGSVGILKALNDPDHLIIVPAAVKPQFEQVVSKLGIDPNKVVSYNKFLKDFSDDRVPSTIVVDEAHRLGSLDSPTNAKIVDRLHKAKNLILLSATPFKNRLEEFSPLYSLLRGERLTPEQFAERYKKRRGFFESVLSQYFPIIKYFGDSRAYDLDKLIKDIKNHIDYTPSEIEGVDVDEEIVDVGLSERQKRLLAAIKEQDDKFLTPLDKEIYHLTFKDIRGLKSFHTGERQAVLSDLPFRKGEVTPDTAYDSFLHSPRLKKALSEIKKFLQNEKGGVLVYSNYPYAGLYPLSEALRREGIPHGFFHGELNDQQRLEVVKNYNEGKYRVFLLSPAGSEGLSLKGTRLIQVLDPHWNDVRTLQAQSRGIRTDSHLHLPVDLRNVKVQYFFTKNVDYLKPSERMLSRLKYLKDIYQTIREIDKNVKSFSDVQKNLSHVKKILEKIEKMNDRKIIDHFLLHTSKMKRQLFDEFIDKIEEMKKESRDKQQFSLQDLHQDNFLKTICLLPDRAKKAAFNLVNLYPQLIVSSYLDFAEENNSSLQKVGEDIFDKIVASRNVLGPLLLAKYFSDKEMYDVKTDILRNLIKKKPEDWFIDSEQEYTVGITHRPTNFKFHLPKFKIADLLPLKDKKKKDNQARQADDAD